MDVWLFDQRLSYNKHL